MTALVKYTEKEISDLGFCCEQEIVTFFRTHETATIIDILDSDVHPREKEWAIEMLDEGLWKAATQGINEVDGDGYLSSHWKTIEANIRNELAKATP